MAGVEKISVALPPELLSMVKRAVESGAYASTSEVIRDALRDWRLREDIRKAELERLRHAWQEGVASGPSQPFDIDAIKKAARTRSKEASGRRDDG